MIELRVRKALREFTLDVELTFEPGVTLLVGPSGAGKSTLLRIVAGLVRPDAGRITLAGRVLHDGRVDVPAFRREVAYVFQEYALFPHLDVLDNVGYGLAARGAGRAERRSAAARGSNGWGSARWPRRDRARSRAASASGSRSRERSPGSREQSCSTSRSPRSTKRREGTCATSCGKRWPRSTFPSSW